MQYAVVEPTGSPVDEANPVTSGLIEGMFTLRRAIGPDLWQGPSDAIVVVVEDALFDALRTRMLAEEAGGFFWRKPRRKRPDDRPWTMVGGLVLVKESAAATFLPSVQRVVPPCRPAAPQTGIDMEIHDLARAAGVTVVSASHDVLQAIRSVRALASEDRAVFLAVLDELRRGGGV